MPALRLRLRTTCVSCGNPVPLISAAQFVPCPSCDTAAKLGPSAFAWVVAPGVLARRSSSEGSDLLGEAEPSPVECPRCRAKLDDDAIERGLAGGAIPCACGSEVPVRAVPAGFGGNRWWAALVGERELESPAPMGQPVAFPCTNCGGQLLVDGTTRAPSCRHCNVRAWLPDDLWRSLHPLPRAEPFYLWVDRAWVDRWDRESRSALRGALLAGLVVWGGLIAIGLGYGSGPAGTDWDILGPALCAGWLPAWAAGAFAYATRRPKGR